MFWSGVYLAAVTAISPVTDGSCHEMPATEIARGHEIQQMSECKNVTAVRHGNFRKKSEAGQGKTQKMHDLADRTENQISGSQSNLFFPRALLSMRRVRGYESTPAGMSVEISMNSFFSPVCDDANSCKYSFQKDGLFHSSRHSAADPIKSISRPFMIWPLLSGSIHVEFQEHKNHAAENPLSYKGPGGIKYVPCDCVISCVLTSEKPAARGKKENVVKNKPPFREMILVLNVSAPPVIPQGNLNIESYLLSIIIEINRKPFSVKSSFASDLIWCQNPPELA